MVFDPTFHEISGEADGLPDLDGSGPQGEAFDEVEDDDLEPLGDE